MRQKLFLRRWYKSFYVTHTIADAYLIYGYILFCIMKIVICGSLDFTKEINEVRNKLKESGHKHKVVIPRGSELILSNTITLQEIRIAGPKHKQDGDVIRYYYKQIQNSDAILVLNYDKRGIKNYIGGNTFLEIGFAHVLGKKIFLTNPVPEIEYYKTEIEAINPIIIHGDFSLL